MERALETSPRSRIIGRQDNIVMVDFARPSAAHPPEPRFPGGGAMRAPMSQRGGWHNAAKLEDVPEEVGCRQDR